MSKRINSTAWRGTRCPDPQRATLLKAPGQVSGAVFFAAGSPHFAATKSSVRPFFNSPKFWLFSLLGRAPISCSMASPMAARSSQSLFPAYLKSFAVFN